MSMSEDSADVDKIPTLDDILSDLTRESSSGSSVQPLLDQMYRPSEAIFGALAKKMVSLGWSVFPQTSDGSRRPGIAMGQTIKWSEEHNLAERLPTPEALEIWCQYCSTLNVAAVFGPASGNTFALDIDVLDESLSRKLQDLADDILGYTPYRRVGLHPKIALIYRHAEDDPISNISRLFVGYKNGEMVASEDGVEIVARGKALTFAGKHHRTGRYFTWLDAVPFENGPELAPLVTSEQVQTWIEAADSIRRFHRGASFDVTSITWDWDDDQSIHVPKLRLSAGGAPWVENKQGKVIDGREEYLRRLVFRIVMANPGAATDPSGDGIKKLCAIAHDQFTSTAETTGRWAGNNLMREIQSKVTLVANKIKRQELKPYEPVRDARGNYVQSASNRAFAPPRAVIEGEDSLTFLAPSVDAQDAARTTPNATSSRTRLRCLVRDPEETKAEDRSLEPDRTRVAKKVTEGLQDAFNSFFDDVYRPLDQRQDLPGVHILKAPTGAGKTSRAIRYIAADSRTKEDYDYIDEDGKQQRGRCPILFLLPTYENIEELRSRSESLNLDGTLSDEELREQAEAKGLIKATDLDARLADLRRDALAAGLKTMIYKGKIKSGCQMAEKISLAMEAGISTAGFCKSVRKDKEGNEEEVYCEFYHNCPAIRQRDQISHVHVVFMPHPFMALNIPEELKYVRAVVADERIHHLFLHTTTFHLSTLTIPRKKPRLTKREKAKGLQQEDLLMDRNMAADVAKDALDKNECPAAALYKLTTPTGTTGAMLVKNAMRVCSSAITRETQITPEMTLQEVRELCATPTGHELREEHRFWSIIADRLEQLNKDQLVKESIASLKRVLRKRQETGEDSSDVEARLARLAQIEPAAKGDRDYRIQLQMEKRANGHIIPMVRISWRQTPNWVGTPLLLLDASAAPDIIKKIWDGTEVVVHDISAPLNVRVVGIIDKTYSNASIVASPYASEQEKLFAGNLLSKLRKAISMVSGYYGWSRVVAGSSIIIRKALNTAWACPGNVDWCHYGAMRGLDFAKHHAAAISIGRMEVPIRTIDGLVAALTYDDPEPEKPYDIDGKGVTADDKPLMLPLGTQRIKMRSGHDVEIPVPMFPGKWGRMIQKQYREEELGQFLGRLRPVYREGEAPIWFAFSSVIPEEVIVDDLMTIDDFLACKPIAGGKHHLPTNLWDAVRRTDGIVDARLLSKIADDTYASPQDALQEMRAFGFTEDYPEIRNRALWGFVPIRWREGATDAWRYSYVAGHHPDPQHHFTRAMSEHLSIDVQEAMAMDAYRQRNAAIPREMDKIELALGESVDRVVNESRLMQQAARYILEHAKADDIQRDHEVEGEDRLQLPLTATMEIINNGIPIKFDVTVNELQAQNCLEMMWMKNLSEQDEKITSPVLEVDATNEENLAGSMHDRDMDDSWNIPW